MSLDVDWPTSENLAPRKSIYENYSCDDFIRQLKDLLKQIKHTDSQLERRFLMQKLDLVLKHLENFKDYKEGRHFLSYAQIEQSHQVSESLRYTISLPLIAGEFALDAIFAGANPLLIIGQHIRDLDFAANLDSEVFLDVAASYLFSTFIAGWLNYAITGQTLDTALQSPQGLILVVIAVQLLINLLWNQTFNQIVIHDARQMLVENQLAHNSVPKRSPVYTSASNSLRQNDSN